MRLIDADAFFERIQNDTSLCAEIKLHGLKVLKKYLNLQPTAYSVNKVIEEVSEIVKQGGISDDTDNMCEWKYTKEIMDNAEFKVGCNTNALKRGVVPNNFSYHDFKYCPYCGKKIKVVE